MVRAENLHQPRHVLLRLGQAVVLDAQVPVGGGGGGQAETRGSACSSAATAASGGGNCAALQQPRARPHRT